MTVKRYGGTFWGGENILYFECGGDDLGEYDCQNLSDHTFKVDIFYFCTQFP